MDTYSLLREIADSWGLLALCAFFVGTAAWILRPGAAALHEEAAALPFKEDTPPRVACPNACPGCTCAGTALDFMERAHK